MAPNLQIRHVVRAFRLQSQRRRYWMNHHLLQGICRWAFDHQAGFHAPSSKAPNKRCPFGNQLGQRGWRYIPSEVEKSNVCISISLNYCNNISKRFSYSWYFHQPNAEQASSLPTLLYMWVSQSDATKCYVFLSYILKFFQSIVLIFLRKAKSSILSSCQPHLYKSHSKWTVKEKSCLTISNLDTKLIFFRSRKQINETNNIFIISSETTFL